jgi:hypothetical protein
MQKGNSKVQAENSTKKADTIKSNKILPLYLASVCVKYEIESNAKNLTTNCGDLGLYCNCVHVQYCMGDIGKQQAAR